MKSESERLRPWDFLSKTCHAMSESFPVVGRCELPWVSCYSKNLLSPFLMSLPIIRHHLAELAGKVLQGLPRRFSSNFSRQSVFGGGHQRTLELKLGNLNSYKGNYHSLGRERRSEGNLRKAAENQKKEIQKEKGVYQSL